jgi:hypothetical protein
MADHSRSTDVLREAQRDARQLLVDGVTWLVYELPPATFDRRGTSSLVFESEGAVRRVRDYPADWRNLSNEALYPLSWSP